MRISLRRFSAAGAFERDRKTGDEQKEIKVFGRVDSADNLPAVFANNFISYSLPSEKKADMNALDAVSRNVRFCRCTPFGEASGFGFRFDIAGLKPVGAGKLSDGEVKTLMHSLVAVLGFIKMSGLYTENLVLLPDRVFTDGRDFFFQYVPVKRRREQKPAKLLASVNRFFSMLSPSNALFSRYLSENRGQGDPSKSISAFAHGIFPPQRGSVPPQSRGSVQPPRVGYEPKGVKRPGVETAREDSEGETTYFGAKTAPENEDSEGETTYFGARTAREDEDSEGETTYFGARTAPEDESSEGETTYFGARTAPEDEDSEGETTYFGARTAPEDEDSEGETTYFGAKTAPEDEDPEGETTLFLSEYRPYDSEGETTVLGAYPTVSAPGVSLVRAINGEEIPVPAGISVIGSFPKACDVVIPNRSVSRRHAEITVENGSVFIRDLDSTNGTIADGIVLGSDSKAEIYDGSFVSFGSESVHVRIK